MGGCSIMVRGGGAMRGTDVGAMPSSVDAVGIRFTLDATISAFVEG